MLTKDEERFLEYWAGQRQRKRQYLRKLSIGLPLGVLMAAAVLVNLFSGWYTKADMEIRSQSSLVIVVLVALLGIVVFITIFSARHRWDQNEKSYQELLQKKEGTPVQRKASN